MNNFNKLPEDSPVSFLLQNETDCVLMATTDKPTMPKRRISEHDRVVARNMKAIWTFRKDSLGLNQTKAAAAMNMTQSAFGQYLRCDLPANTDFILKFARLMGVDPLTLDPKLESYGIIAVLPVKTLTVPVIGTLGTRATMKEVAVAIEEDRMGHSMVAIATNVADHPTLSPNEILLADLSTPPHEGDSVVFRLSNNGPQFQYGELLQIKPGGGYVIRDKATRELYQFDTDDVFDFTPSPAVVRLPKRATNHVSSNSG